MLGLEGVAITNVARQANIVVKLLFLFFSMDIFRLYNNGFRQAYMTLVGIVLRDIFQPPCVLSLQERSPSLAFSTFSPITQIENNARLFCPRRAIAVADVRTFSPYMSLRLDRHYDSEMPTWSDAKFVQELGPRLGCIASLVYPGARVLDAGTDHGLLAIALAGGRANYVVASDVHEEPLANCRRNLAAADPATQARVDVRLGDGLSVLRPGEVDTLTVAGMGGAKVLELVFGGPPTEALGIRRAVLQPTSDVEGMRAALSSRGWTVTHEGLTSSGRWAHVRLAAEPSAPAAAGPWTPTLSEEDAVLGPFLRRRPACALYRAWLRHRLGHFKAVADGAARSGRCGPGEREAGRRAFIIDRFLRDTA